MFEDAPPAIRDGLQIGSGFRSIERQQQLWEDAVRKYGSPEAARKWVAPPGKSEHNSGTAVDIWYNGKRLTALAEEGVSLADIDAARAFVRAPELIAPGTIATLEATGAERCKADPQGRR